MQNIFLTSLTLGLLAATSLLQHSGRTPLPPSNYVRIAALKTVASAHKFVSRTINENGGGWLSFEPSNQQANILKYSGDGCLGKFFFDDPEVADASISVDFRLDEYEDQAVNSIAFYGPCASHQVEDQRADQRDYTFNSTPPLSAPER